MNKSKTDIDHLCPCCRGVRRQVDISDFTEFACANCDHVWFEAEAGQASQDAYEGSAKYQEYYVGKPPHLWYHRRALDYVIQHKPSGRTLDFGCFDGFFVKRMRDAGIDAYGCDWNRTAIAYGSTAFQLGNRLSRDPGGQYDVIVALEVIEHFQNPQDFIDIVRQHLAPRGLLILSCPNKNALYRPRTDAPPHHFSRFSKSSLQHLLERNRVRIECHEHEMSSFQLFRNTLGDTLRQKAPLLGQKGATAGDASGFRQLKQLANSLSGVAGVMSRPVDIVMHGLGLSYISQFLVGTFSDDN